MRSILLGTMQSGKPRTLGSNTGVSGDVFLTFLVRGIPCEIWKLINVFFNGPSHMSTYHSIPVPISGNTYFCTLCVLSTFYMCLYSLISIHSLYFSYFVFHQFFLVLSALCMCLYSLLSIHSLYISYFVFLSILSYSTTSTGPILSYSTTSTGSILSYSTTSTGLFGQACKGFYLYS